MYHTHDGRVGCCWEGTCDATEATGALMTGANATLDLAGDGTNAGEVWVEGLKFYRRLVLP